MSQELLIAASALAAVLVLAVAFLKAWHDWLALKGRELELRQGIATPDGGWREGAARIELADLRERIRQLEAIASGVDP
jgi:hypothetical protein